MQSAVMTKAWIKYLYTIKMHIYLYNLCHFTVCILNFALQNFTEKNGTLWYTRGLTAT